MHLAASLEILRGIGHGENETHYCLWGSRTSYPGRMSIFFESLSGKPSKHHEALVRLADNSVHLNNIMDFESLWVHTTTGLLMRELETFSNISQLKNLTASGVNPGPALANEITTLTKNRDLDLSLNKRLIERLIQSYLQVYSATVLFITRHDIEQIQIFNGRFLHERAVWDAARSQNIDVVLFETTRSRYFQRREGFHNRTNNQLVMLEHWNSSSDPLSKKLEVGARYFSELRSVSNPFRTEHSSKPRSTRPYFVYFSSSDDEAVGFWDEWNEGLGEQISCVLKLQAIFDTQDKIELIVRLHPNLVNKSEEQKFGWQAIRDTRSTKVIAAEDQASSYDLLDNSIGSITFGSTLGLESAFALKPSLLIADSGYDLLGVVDKAKNWKDVSDWILGGYKIDENQLQERKSNSCIRGYFLATGGIDFRFSQLVEKSWGAWEAISFDGMSLSTSKLNQIYKRIISRMKFREIRKLINSDK
jgi:hypothetical protein